MCNQVSVCTNSHKVVKVIQINHNYFCLTERDQKQKVNV